MSPAPVIPKRSPAVPEGRRSRCAFSCAAEGERRRIVTKAPEAEEGESSEEHDDDSDQDEDMSEGGSPPALSASGPKLSSKIRASGHRATSV